MKTIAAFAAACLLLAACSSSGGNTVTGTPVAPLTTPPSAGGDAKAKHTILFEAVSDKEISSVVYYTLAIDNSDSQNIRSVKSPWSAREMTDSATATPSIGVQAAVTGTIATCRITIDGVVKVEKTSRGPSAYTLCTVM